MGKGEIAHYGQFLLFPVFIKGLFPRGVKSCYCVGMGQPFPKQQIWDPSKLKESADDNLELGKINVSHLTEKKTLWKKGKTLVTNIF